jgi:hypothetical protein
VTVLLIAAVPVFAAILTAIAIDIHRERKGEPPLWGEPR